MPERHYKERTGKVFSTKMNKTIMVEVTRLVPHAEYRKVIRQRKKYAVHDESGKAKVGDTVKIRETKPISKTKRWCLVEVMTPAVSS